MKRMNNKGFAISTLIYGLSIMGIMIVAILMATMAQTRNNNTSLVKSIEEDLNRFSKTETSFKPRMAETGPDAQEYIVPTTGWYVIELWGTQGGGNGGKGAYTRGTVELSEGDVLYFYVGEHQVSGGGYATEVRLEKGKYTEPNSYETRIMVAGGGGSNANAAGGTIIGYNDKMNSLGGIINISGVKKDFALIPKSTSEEDSENTTTNGTLLGYNKDYQISTTAVPLPVDRPVSPPTGCSNCGGGDGYFPSNSATTGGSSFIAGYTGCLGISRGQLTENPKVELYDRQYDENSGVSTATYSNAKLGEYYFVDNTMIPGVKTGDGFAKIERLLTKKDESVELERINKKLNNVRYIKDCVKRTCTNGSNNSVWNKILFTIRGIVYEPTINTSGDCPECATIDIGSAYNLDEIVVFHKETGIDYKNEIISVSTDGENWINLKDWTLREKEGATECSEYATTYDQKQCTDLSETETVTGNRISAYKNDPTLPLPNGNYIIQSVLSENKVMTAAESNEKISDEITFEPYVGEKRQKWNIELITDKKINPNYIEDDPSTYEYKVIELARNKALTIKRDENVLFNTLIAMEKFNEKARNEPQIWKIHPVGNGTYTIETVMPPITPTANTGFLILQTNSSSNETYNRVIIGRKNYDTARFKFIQLDYSSN